MLKLRVRARGDWITHSAGKLRVGGTSAVKLSIHHAMTAGGNSHDVSQHHWYDLYVFLRKKAVDVAFLIMTGSAGAIRWARGAA